jgi:hypothetical protein
VPDVGPNVSGLYDLLPDGSRRIFVIGIRIVDHPDGSIERARETLPSGMPQVTELPARLGGGMLLVSRVGDSAKVFRTDDWLSRPVPFVRLRSSPGNIVVGLDRLYARLPSDIWTGLDPRTGAPMPLGPLPVATRIDTMGFADAWRGVVVADLRGPMATFDSGNSWHAIPLAGSNVSVRLLDGDLVLQSTAGRLSVGVHGELLAIPPASPSDVSKPGDHDAPVPPLTRRLGSRPLRAVVEDGWPASAQAIEAIFARAGTVYRVRLSDGAVVGEAAGLFPDEFTSCHAIAVGRSFGFVCGGPAAGTAVYAFEPPLGVRELMRFSRGRSVVSSGNGGIVVRGPCARDAPADGDIEVSAAGPLKVRVARGRSIAFCAMGPSGVEREIVLRPELAGSPEPTVRAVVLGDDTVGLVVTPVPRLLLFRPRSSAADVYALSSTLPSSVLDKALWLDGLYEVEARTIAGWVQIGDDLAGVRVSASGLLTVGASRWKVETSAVAGPLAVDWRPAARQALETTDGGLTARRIDLPPTDVLRQRRDVAACSPVGCASGSFIRVGWGGDDAEIEASDPPELRALARAPRAPLSLRCAWTGRVAGAAPAQPIRARPARKDKPSVVLRAFRGAPPPAIASGDAAVEAETPASDDVQAHAYAYGPRGADWSRAGRWLAKFDDPFDLSGVRATSASALPWSDDAAVAEAMSGLHARLDPAGTAALLYASRVGKRSEVFGIAPGEAIVPFRGVDEGSLPDPVSVVRIGAVYYFLSARSGLATTTTLYRVEAGRARAIARLPRVSRAGDPTLVRRAIGAGLGILAPESDSFARDRYVIPVDPDTGELAEPVRLLAADLGGRLPRRCRGDEDGWWVSMTPFAVPSFDLGTSAPVSVSRVALRLRVEPGEACVEAIAASADRIPGAAPAPADANAVPMLATDGAGRRWEYACRP